MGLGQNINTFTPIMPPQYSFSGLTPWRKSSESETAADTEEKLKKDKAQKKAAEFLERLEMYKNNAAQEEQDEMAKPLTKAEKNALRKEGLKFEEEEIKKSEGTLAASMLFTTPFLIPTVKTAIKSKKNTVEMFYKNGSPHMDLFTKNPDLMINAQESMQKLERKFAKDFKAAKGNRALMKTIADERNVCRNIMQNALNTNNELEIAKATEQCKTALGVKNGRVRRLIRGMKNQPKIQSRFDAVAAADGAGKFSSVKPPKQGASFLKNMFTNKIMWGMTAAMAILPIALDWGNIQKAKAIDEQNKQKGKNTNYGTEQIKQTGIKSAASALTYSLADTATRTLTKKCLGKFAARLATKIAMKGGCKILGSAIGSIVPGLGTAAGLIIGTLADFALDKFVFSKMDFFKNTSVKKAELYSSNDNELLRQIGEQYSNGNKIHNKKLLSLLKKKCGDDNFNEMKRMHNMTEEERNNYLAKIQALQEQKAEQLQQDQEQETMVA